MKYPPAKKSTHVPAKHTKIDILNIDHCNAVGTLNV